MPMYTFTESWQALQNALTDTNTTKSTQTEISATNCVW